MRAARRMPAGVRAVTSKSDRAAAFEGVAEDLLGVVGAEVMKAGEHGAHAGEFRRDGAGVHGLGPVGAGDGLVGEEIGHGDLRSDPLALEFRFDDGDGSAGSGTEIDDFV